MIKVKSEEELKKAIKNKEPTILIINKKLALKIKKIKSIRKWSKRAIISSLAIFGIGTGVASIGLLIPAILGIGIGGGVGTTTGIAGIVGVPLAISASSSSSAGTTAAIASGSSITTALIISFWKDYEITEFDVTTKFLKLSIRKKKS